MRLLVVSFITWKNGNSKLVSWFLKQDAFCYSKPRTRNVKKKGRTAEVLEGPSSGYQMYHSSTLTAFQKRLNDEIEAQKGMSLDTIQTLKLDKVKCTQEDLKLLGQCSSLISLSLTEADIDSLHGFPVLPCLTTVRLKPRNLNLLNRFFAFLERFHCSNLFSQFWQTIE